MREYYSVDFTDAPLSIEGYELVTTHHDPLMRRSVAKVPDPQDWENVATSEQLKNIERTSRANLRLFQQAGVLYFLIRAWLDEKIADDVFAVAVRNTLERVDGVRND